VPNDREIARAYSRGELAIDALPSLRSLFLGLFDKLVLLAGQVPKRHVTHRDLAEPMTEAHAGLPSETLQLGRKNDVPELVVISGKGGTGKTSITASFFALAHKTAVADCDVDAADLHLVLDPVVRRRWPFAGGSTAVVDPRKCTGCGLCAEHCRFDALRTQAGEATLTYEVDAIGCEGCGVCVDICPEDAIELTSSAGGEWFVSDTRHGPMAHARLGIAQENSGKLVSLVRREGKALAVLKHRELLICDGSPGIGCPVIASIAGARMVLVVTEPTLSGLHDLRRVAELTRQFHIKTAICINKADINPELSDRIESEAAALGLDVLGRIRYDDSVTTAQVRRRSVVEIEPSAAGADIRALWERVRDALG